MDTDSFVVNKPLPDWMVSKNELGKLKLEHIVKEGVFLARPAGRKFMHLKLPMVKRLSK